ncbi:hypothetical protein PGB90_001191 [Kerria lacca]
MFLSYNKLEEGYKLNGSNNLSLESFYFILNICNSFTVIDVETVYAVVEDIPVVVVFDNYKSAS